MNSLKIFLWNLYPPFCGAGIRIEAVDPEWRWLKASVRLRWWNRNIVGTMFGGAIYAACDPFHMVLLMNRLGKAYVVRDKGAEIRFLKKGMSRVDIHFELGEEMVAQILASPETLQERKFLAQAKDESGAVIAEVVKILHIRRVGS